MSLTVNDVCRVLNDWAPEPLAEDWDNVGLLVGDPQAKVTRILASLEVTPAELKEARRENCEMIVAHHPVIFHPLRAVRRDSPASAVVYAALCQGLHLYAAHSNLDRAIGGTNDVLAEQLGLQGPRILQPSPPREDYKLVVFTPPEAVEGVIQALAESGAGRIGAYSHCTFRAPGTGTYLPQEGAQPYAGEVGRLAQEEEFRLETVVPRGSLGPVLTALRAAHPYEEVAYDLYRLENEASNTGLGRIGTLAEPQPLGVFAEEVQTRLPGESCRVVGESQRTVQTVAVCGGSGAHLIPLAHRSGADVLVTGDVKHHHALEAAALGLALIDAGHYATERPVVSRLAMRLRKALPRLEVYETNIAVDPFHTL